MDDHTCDECSERSGCRLPELAIAIIDSMADDALEALQIVEESYGELAEEEGSDSDEYMMYNYLVRHYKAEVAGNICLN